MHNVDAEAAAEEEAWGSSTPPRHRQSGWAANQGASRYGLTLTLTQTLTPTLTLTLLALTLTLTLTSSGDVDVAIGEDSVAPPGDGGGGPESERGDGENFLARRPRRYPRPEVPPLEASEDAQPEGSNQYTI